LTNWLSRHFIEESEFEYTLSCLRDIATPKEDGLTIRKKLMSADAKIKKLAGLTLTLPITLGRMMICNMQFAYVVITVAAIMAHHDMEFATQVLCNIIADNDVDYDPSVDDHRPYSTHQSRIKPVIRTIVESISLNVVNCSYGFPLLLEELRQVCSHSTTQSLFATLAGAIIRHSSHDLILYSSRFYGDIVAWGLVHFHGCQEPYVSVPARVKLDSIILSFCPVVGRVTGTVLTTAQSISR